MDENPYYPNPQKHAGWYIMATISKLRKAFENSIGILHDIESKE
jgi:hypothetical protein